MVHLGIENLRYFHGGDGGSVAGVHLIDQQLFQNSANQLVGDVYDGLARHTRQQGQCAYNKPSTASL